VIIGGSGHDDIFDVDIECVRQIDLLLHVYLAHSDFSLLVGVCGLLLLCCFVSLCCLIWARVDDDDDSDI